MRSRSLVTKTVFRDSYYEKGIIPNVQWMGEAIYKGMGVASYILVKGGS